MTEETNEITVFERLVIPYINFRVMSCKNFQRNIIQGKICKFSRHVQFIIDVSDVLHLPSGYNFGLQNFNLNTSL